MNMYPTKEQLERIHEIDKLELPIKEKVPKMLSHLKSIWHYDNFFVDNGKDGFELHTGGWSGNEDIISELRKTMFWIFFWQRTERGGHYFFDYRAVGSYVVVWSKKVDSKEESNEK